MMSHSTATAAKYHGSIACPELDTETRKPAASGMPALAGARPVTPIESTDTAVSVISEVSAHWSCA